MPSPFLHLEILGPRSTLDRWLAAVQDHGGCHLADALHGLEGEGGIGRPAPDEAVAREALLRSESLGALRGLDRVLPARAAGEVPADAEALRREALAVAGRLRTALERAREADREVRRLDALRAAVRALASAGETAVRGRGWSAPREAPGAASLARRLRRVGTGRVVSAAADFEAVAVLPADGPLLPREAEVAAEVGAAPLAWPADLAGRPLDEARRSLDQRWEEAIRLDREAALALDGALRQDGPVARRLLAHLEDAEARFEARRSLACLGPVAAARVYVRREDAADLRGRLQRAFGEAVVLRPLADADDAPALPRSAPATPLAALALVRWERFGETAPAALLAVAAPLVAAAVAADLAWGIALFLLGGLLGVGARPGSTRRDAAFLAQAAGLVALLLGFLSGRALGVAGVRWFGDGWGPLGRDAAFGPTGGSFADVALALGAVAAVFAAWGGLAAALHAARGMAARARQALVASLSFAGIAGAASLALGAGHPLRHGWTFALAAWVALAVLAGRRGLLRAGLDLAAVVRLGAVGGSAVALARWAGEVLAEPSARAAVAAACAVILGSTALVVDSAHVATGAPYEIALAGRGLAPPFRPLGRRAGPAAGEER